MYCGTRIGRTCLRRNNGLDEHAYKAWPLKWAFTCYALPIKRTRLRQTMLNTNSCKAYTALVQ